MQRLWYFHCVKTICIRSYSGPYFPSFVLNTESYGVSLRIQPECGKIRTRVTPHKGTFLRSVQQRFNLHYSKTSKFSVNKKC